MEETLRHREAFEFYYALGSNRSYPQVASQFTISLTSVKKWAKSFKWQDRVKERDIKNTRKLEEKTDETIIQAKSKYLAIIQNTLYKYEVALQSGDIKINNVKDLATLANLEMSLREEEVPEEDKTINIIFKTLPKRDITNLNDGGK